MPTSSTALNDFNEHKKAKVLILGAAESGKSTICRHMRQLHGDKFGDAEMLHFKQTIRASCIEYFVKMLSDLLEYKPLLARDREQCVTLIEQYKAKTDIDRNFLDIAVSIWKQQAVQEHIADVTRLDSFSASNNDEAMPEDIASTNQRDKPVQKLHSDNPANHFLRFFDKILAEGYTPRLEDILNLRIATTGNKHANDKCIIFPGQYFRKLFKYFKHCSILQPINIVKTFRIS